MWDKMLEFTGGDVNQVIKFSKLFENTDGNNDECKKRNKNLPINSLSQHRECILLNLELIRSRGVKHDKNE